MSMMLDAHRTPPPGTMDSELQRQTDDTIGNRRCLPDPETCRTTSEDQFSDSSKCQVEKPDSCGFAVRLGSGVYCYHPVSV